MARCICKKSIRYPICDGSHNHNGWSCAEKYTAPYIPRIKANNEASSFTIPLVKPLYKPQISGTNKVMSK